MDLDLNQAGKTYSYLAIGGDVPHYGILSPAAVRQYRSIESFLSREWQSADKNRQSWLLRINACLEKLSGALLQISRIKAGHDSLMEQAPKFYRMHGSGELVGIRAQKECADFEALLLQGRAALDRLTRFIAAKFKQQCNSYKSLPTILGQFKDRDERAAVLLSLLSAATWLNGIFVDTKRGQSLRDFVAHYGGISEVMDNCFGIAHVGEKGVLIYDCESRGIPLFQTSWESAKYLSFIILNSLALFSRESVLDLAEYEPNWQNSTVVFSAYISQTGGRRVTVIRRMTPAGFELKTRPVAESMLSNTVSISRAKTLVGRVKHAFSVWVSRFLLTSNNVHIFRK